MATPTSTSTTRTTASTPTPRTTAIDPSTPTINITVDITGGLELLFSNTTSHALSIPSKTPKGTPFTVGDLIPWLCQNLMRDSRKDLFVLAGAIRPGILVLINEADWELVGEDKYELNAGDNVLFVSTLHGG